MRRRTKNGSTATGKPNHVVGFPIIGIALILGASLDGEAFFESADQPRGWRKGSVHLVKPLVQQLQDELTEGHAKRRSQRGQGSMPTSVDSDVQDPLLHDDGSPSKDYQPG